MLSKPSDIIDHEQSLFYSKICRKEVSEHVRGVSSEVTSSAGAGLVALLHATRILCSLEFLQSPRIFEQKRDSLQLSLQLHEQC